MKHQEKKLGFSEEQQANYEKQLIDRFGDQIKDSIAASHRNIKNWTKADWEKSSGEFDAICNELAGMVRQHLEANSQEVQRAIRRHYQWLKRFWTPTKESYSGHGQLILQSDLRKVYEAHHPQLAEFLAGAMRIFAERELS